MKKMLILVVVLLAVPVMAASTVTITCSVDVPARTVQVSYSSNLNLIRGFGLDLNVAAGGNITAVSNLNTNYRIYPGQIVIDDSNRVTDYNTPYVPGSLGQPSVTIEMGSLYTMDPNYQYKDPNYGYNKKPAASGTLLKFTVSGTGNANGTVTENQARGGIVMEDPNESPTGLGPPLCTWSLVVPTDCLKNTATEYPVWADPMWNKPNCWCYKRNCRGDTDNTRVGFWVYSADLNLLKSAYGKADTRLRNITNGICADFGHDKVGFRVYSGDLNILKSYYAKADTRARCCDADENCTLASGDKWNFWK